MLHAPPPHAIGSQIEKMIPLGMSSPYEHADQILNRNQSSAHTHASELLATLDKKRRASFIRKKREEAVSAGKAEPDAFQTTQNSRASADSTEPAADSEEKEFSTSTEFTPAIQTEEVKYIQPGERTSEGLGLGGSITRPNYEDILRRVSVVLQQHIEKCERRLAEATPETMEEGLFHVSKMEEFSEENFISPQYVYHFVRAPMMRLGFSYGIRKHTPQYKKPTLNDVHEFLSDLFFKAQLSPECSIVCLIYVERLMEKANVPIVARNWRPILICGLLMASKVWQDMSSWNVEVSQIFPEYSLKSINRLERIFCSSLKWELYISSSLYAKYYFALRSLTAKKDFRRNYNAMVMTTAPGAKQVAARSGDVNCLDLNLSRSL